MKWPSGCEASSITPTASRIAATITITYCSAMPTAAITESSENTMSMTAICAITAPNEPAGLGVDVLGLGSPAIWSRISIMPLNTQEHAAERSAPGRARRSHGPNRREQVVLHVRQEGERQQQRDRG